MKLAYSHVMFYVSDFNRALEWYQRVLNFKVTFSAAPHYAALSNGFMNIAIHPGKGTSTDQTAPMPCLTSGDFDETIAALRSHGVRVEEPRQQGESPRFTGFYDSEGNVWGLEEAR
ncbi:MAG TPA: VOC family protein [Tepidisphaeraceae bacterium]|jgi:catechol 2,3-dioxygenase-like lactoylglutathione lyase family enzyme